MNKMNIDSTVRAQGKRQRKTFKVAESTLPGGQSVVRIDTSSPYGVDKKDRVLTRKTDDGWEPFRSVDELKAGVENGHLSVGDLRTWKDGAFLRKGNGKIEEGELQEFFPKPVVYEPEWAKTAPRKDPREEAKIEFFPSTGVFELNWQEAEGKPGSPEFTYARDHKQGAAEGAYNGGTGGAILGALAGGGILAGLAGGQVRSGILYLDGVAWVAGAMLLGAFAGAAAGAAVGGSVGGALGFVVGSER